jgi:hypothetical protein
MVEILSEPVTVDEVLKISFAKFIAKKSNNNSALNYINKIELDVKKVFIEGLGLIPNKNGEHVPLESSFFKLVEYDFISSNYQKICYKEGKKEELWKKFAKTNNLYLKDVSNNDGTDFDEYLDILKKDGAKTEEAIGYIKKEFASFKKSMQLEEDKILSQPFYEQEKSVLDKVMNNVVLTYDSITKNQIYSKSEKGLFSDYVTLGGMLDRMLNYVLHLIYNHSENDSIKDNQELIKKVQFVLNNALQRAYEIEFEKDKYEKEFKKYMQKDDDKEKISKYFEDYLGTKTDIENVTYEDFLNDGFMMMGIGFSEEEIGNML